MHFKNMLQQFESAILFFKKVEWRVQMGRVDDCIDSAGAAYRYPR